MSTAVCFGKLPTRVFFGINIAEGTHRFPTRFAALVRPNAPGLTYQIPLRYADLSVLRNCLGHSPLVRAAHITTWHMAPVNPEWGLSRHKPLSTTEALQRIRDAARKITTNPMLSSNEQERAIQAFSISLQPACHRPAQAPVRAPGRKPKPSRAERYECFFREIRAITYYGPSLPVETFNTGLELLLLTVVALGKARIADLKNNVRKEIHNELKMQPAQFLSGQLSRCAFSIECTGMDMYRTWCFCLHKDSKQTKTRCTQSGTADSKNRNTTPTDPIVRPYGHRSYGTAFGRGK